MSSLVEVSQFPDCDICGKEAHYDAKTRNGPWAYLCDKHFVDFGCSLGTGKGQKFYLSKDDQLSGSETAISSPES